jgi:organic hydroperoxide reductase OsmC/OhrA
MTTTTAENVPRPTPAGTARRAPFPHRYTVSLRGAAESAIVAAPPRPDIEGGAPAEFGGRDDWWSPEHLLLSSLLLCLKTTFDSFAARDKLAPHRYLSQVEALVDKTAAGLAFTSIVVGVELAVASGETERARALMESAKRWCLVSNTLKPPVELRVVVTSD